MTEVDAVIPENVASLQQQVQSRTTTNSAENTATTNNIALPPSKDQLNGDKMKESTSTEKSDAMDVDAPDTEEDDSQITSSTENGIGVGEDSKMSETRGKRQPSPNQTSSENSKDGSLIDGGDAIAIKDKLENVSKSNPTSSNDEDSSNACDDISQNCDNSPSDKADQNSDSELPAAADTEEGENSTASGTNNGKRFNNNLDKDKENTDGEADADADAASQDESSEARTNSRQQDFNEDMISIEAKDEKLTDVPVDDCSVSQQSVEDPLNSAETEKDSAKKSPIQKENGAASESEKAKDDAGIVDLGDDSDEEMEEIMPEASERNLEKTSNGNDSALNYSSKKATSVCSDSDGAVVIGSDSENEAEQPPPHSKEPQKTVAEKASAPQEIADDDDDDCVVIEDDTPAPPALAELSKRKSMTVDLAANCDDSQPPNKRQRTSLPSSTVSQITIKDARSLMPQDTTAGAKDISNDTGPIYPVNIRPSALATPVTTPPKLVPVSNISNLQQLSAGTTLAGLSSNTNLLPGLTDDMYVLEAPSFIVPYIYEKPPTDNLREIVRGIETKYALSRDDLAEADKSDEFDMMTEQNKEDKDEKTGKKKKRRRGGDDGDESWSEESDEDDDEEDEDSEGGLRTKVLIKEASDDITALKGAIKPITAVTNVSTIDITSSNANTLNKPGQENYFESPLGKFFMDIGVGLVQEFVQSDLIRLQKRKMRKSLGKNITDFERAIAALSGNLEASKKKNSPFKFTMKRCEFCNFKSESALSMANHYETPHMNGQMFKCNFCTYEIRNDKEIVYHMEAVHNIKARLIKPLPYHQCPNCSFEDNGKAKMARHQPVCVKKFRPELNLAPPHDWEAPAKIPRIKPRHGLVGTATAYQAMAAQAAAQKAALASIQQQQQQAAQARSIQAAALAAQNAANKIRGRPPTIAKPGPNPGSPVMRGPNQVRNPMATNVVMSPNNYQLAGAQLIQNANALAKKTLSGQPSISITPLPRQSSSAQVSSPSSSKMPPAGMKPGQSPSGNKAQFVICEICDGYIKDLEQLRNHMQWMHKVKIHPKMIYNRPPLNCQKCQFRFFTDQGLERHLLGSHGLVTSSMQEAANKGKDAGRCPVCGRLYQWKLLNHVSRDHHMTLKPAHLSYKCTVCTATFGMYKQFETHVYTAHSTVAKKAMDGKKNNNASTSSTMTSGSQRSSLGASNDSLLKPLKINDEITIIPQPASKPRITNMESHVID